MGMKKSLHYAESGEGRTSMTGWCDKPVKEPDGGVAFGNDECRGPGSWGAGGARGRETAFSDPPPALTTKRQRTGPQMRQEEGPCRWSMGAVQGWTCIKRQWWRAS